MKWQVYMSKRLQSDARRDNRLSWCTIASKSAKVESLLAPAASIGYGGIEIWGPHLEDYERRKGGLRELALQLQELGLSVAAIAVYFDLLTGPDPLGASEKLCKRYLGYADALGCNLLRAWLAPVGSADISVRDWGLLVQRTKKLVGICSARSNPVTMAIETHAGQPMDSSAATARLVEAVGPTLGVVYDVYNLHRVGETVGDVLSQIGSRIVHVHAKNARVDEEGEVLSCLSEGDLNWNAVVLALRANDYTGWLSVEYFGDELWPSARADFEFLTTVVRQDCHAD